jgi:carbohydrate kinase (thermoresistant glucokinase family)
MIIILMGVSGSGKTTIGKQLALEKGMPFFDADDFHSKENIEKMKNNIPLTDEDRFPWLQLLAEKIKVWEQSGGAILACSALKESYRNILSHKSNVLWIFLSGSFELISNRLENRSNHYMKTSLLQSQFDTLEVPNDAIQINIDNTIEKIMNLINSNLVKHG